VPTQAVGASFRTVDGRFLAAARRPCVSRQGPMLDRLPVRTQNRKSTVQKSCHPDDESRRFFRLLAGTCFFRP
jgi:hypothetical protein